MKVCCIANSGEFLPETYLKPDLYYDNNTTFALTIGKEYVVYAFSEWQGNLWYYICDDNYAYYPMQNPAPLFKIIDNRVSKYWHFEIAPNGLLEVAFEQWFADPNFYDKLTDQEEAEVLIFEKVKELMDAEALSLPSLDKAEEKADRNVREIVNV
jgi:hypothetical protein